MELWTAATWPGKVVFYGLFFSSGIRHFTQGKLSLAAAAPLFAPGIDRGGSW